MLVGRVPLAPHALMQELGERLGEPVGQRLHRDRRVVVVRRLVPGRQLVGAVDPDGERPHVVVRGRHVVGEAAVRALVAVIGLLAQEREARAVDHDVVALGVRRPESVDADGAQRRSLKDLAQERLGVVVELLRRRVREDRRELALELPGVEEELPVDERDEVGQRGLDEARADERRRRRGRRARP